MGLGLFWLLLVFAQYREGTWVDGVWVFDDAAWAFDLVCLSQRGPAPDREGSLYAAELRSPAPFEPGRAELLLLRPAAGVAHAAAHADLSFADSSAVWWALRVVALLPPAHSCRCRRLLRAAAFAVVALSLPGLKDTVLGNVSLLLVLPMAVAWRWLDRPIGSIVMAAAISVRPSLGLFLFWQLLRRQWRASGLDRRRPALRSCS